MAQLFHRLNPYPNANGGIRAPVPNPGDDEFLQLLVLAKRYLQTRDGINQAYRHYPGDYFEGVLADMDRLEALRPDFLAILETLEAEENQ